MSKFLKEAQKKKSGLRKAGDASRDPADLHHDPTPEATAPKEEPESPSDIGADVITDTTPEPKTDIFSDIENDSKTDVISERASISPMTPKTRSSSAATKRAKKTTKKSKSRRRGRPPGPDRVLTSARILPTIDDAITDLCDAANVGTQDVFDAAVARLLVSEGWLTAEEVPHAARDADERIKAHRQQ